MTSPIRGPRRPLSLALRITIGLVAAAIVTFALSTGMVAWVAHEIGKVR